MKIRLNEGGTVVTGIEKIVAGIEDEIRTVCDQNIAKAKTQAVDILEKVCADAENEAKLILKKSAAEAKIAAESIVNKAHSDVRRKALAEKQRVIQSVIDKAKSAFLNAEDYFKKIYALLDKHASGNNNDKNAGEIILSAKDKGRLPEDFEKNIEARGLKLSSMTAEISGGFIIKKGGTEENCSIDALFKNNRDKMSDDIYQILY